MIILFDMVADRVESADDEDCVGDGAQVKDRGISLSGPDEIFLKLSERRGTEELFDDDDGTGDPAVTAALSAGELVPSSTEVAKVLRVLIRSYGLLVALSWDTAFDSATETVVEAIDSHPVICKVLL